MNLIKYVKQTGGSYSLAILFNRLVPERLFRMRRFVIYHIDADKVARHLAASPNTPSPVSLSIGTSESEILALEKLTQFERSYSTGNKIAYAAKLKDQLAAGIWAATGCFDEHELGVRICLNKNQTWLFAAMVSKTLRRRGLYSKLLNFAVTDLARRGHEEHLVAVNPNNIGSDRIHKKLARETVGQVLAFRCWKTTCCWTWGNLQKSATIRWNSSSHPITIRSTPASSD